MLPKTRTSKRLTCRRLLTTLNATYGRIDLLLAMRTFDPDTFERQDELTKLGVDAGKLVKLIQKSFGTEREVCLAMDLVAFRDKWPCAHYF